MATTRESNNNAEVKQTIALLVGNLCHSEHEVGRVNTTIFSNYIQSATRPTYASRSRLPASCTPWRQCPVRPGKARNWATTADGIFHRTQDNKTVARSELHSVFITEVCVHCTTPTNTSWNVNWERVFNRFRTTRSMSTPLHPVRIATPHCTCLQLALLLSAFAEQRPLAPFHLSVRTEQG
jgi:hypothetical protein